MKTYRAFALVFFTLALDAVESQLEFRHRDPGGVGYNHGYSTIDYLLTHRWEKTELLANVRGHVFNDGNFAANGGLGFRYPFRENKLLIGGNIFYDFRQSPHLNSHQLGVGFELLTRKVDFRANGYVPLQRNRFDEIKVFRKFTGTSIIIEQKVKASLPAIECEVGVPLGKWFYAAIGPYYLFKREVHDVSLGNAVGGRLRASVTFDPHVTLGGDLTYDHIFKTRGQGYLTIRLPFPCPKKKCRKRNLFNVPIWRNEIIPLEGKRRLLPLSDVKGSDPIDIFFVNNLFSGAANGSFEAPFSSLKDAEMVSKPGDVIYVLPGDGTPRNMDEGIILKDDQILAGSGTPLEINDIVIPPMTPGMSPVITNTNPDMPVVTNPGKSHMEGFRILDPWEYLSGWSYDSGDAGDYYSAPPTDVSSVPSPIDTGSGEHLSSSDGPGSMGGDFEAPASQPSAEESSGDLGGNFEVVEPDQPTADIDVDVRPPAGDSSGDLSSSFVDVDAHPPGADSSGDLGNSTVDVTEPSVPASGPSEDLSSSFVDVSSPAAETPAAPTADSNPDAAPPPAQGTDEAADSDSDTWDILSDDGVGSIEPSIIFNDHVPSADPAAPSDTDWTDDLDSFWRNLD